MSQLSKPAPIVSSALFRDLMSRFPSGITVVTALDSADQPHGMTASAVAGLSLDPPLVVLCVDRGSDMHPILTEGRAFALNVLAADQESISRRFADEHPDRFAGVEYARGVDGLPLIQGVLAHITCRKWGQYLGGDHTIFVGQVSGGQIFERPPLIHFRRGYTSIR